MERIIIAVLVVVLLLALCAVWRMKAVNKESKRAERIKQAFLQNIHNEIRMPMKAVSAMADTIAQDDLYLSKAEKSNISEQLKYNVSLIGTLMDEVIMFTDSTGRGHALKMESFSPNALCRRSLEANVYSIYHREAVKLNFKRAVSDEFFIKSDRHLVELIVSKLIVNACKFTEQGEVTRTV